jgi:hypothetical protein
MHLPQFKAFKRRRPAICVSRQACARARTEDGQALVEFTLVLVPVLLLAFGIAYFGLALNSWIDETHLASAAARFAAVNTQEPEKEKSLEKWTLESGDNGDVKNAKFSICSPTSKVGDYVQVKLTYMQKWLPLLNVGAETAVTSTAQLRIEVPPAKEYPTTC